MCGAPHQGLEQGLESQPVCLVPAAGGGKCLYLFKPGVYFLTHFKLDQVVSSGGLGYGLGYWVGGWVGRGVCAGMLRGTCER